MSPAKYRFWDRSRAKGKRHDARTPLCAPVVLLKPTAAEAAVACVPRSNGIDFGTTGSEETVVGAVTLHCIGSGRADYTLTLSQGGSGTYSQRAMSNGSNSLPYNLYANPAFTQILATATGAALPYRRNRHEERHCPHSRGLPVREGSCSDFGARWSLYGHYSAT